MGNSAVNPRMEDALPDIDHNKALTSQKRGAPSYANVQNLQTTGLMDDGADASDLYEEDKDAVDGEGAEDLTPQAPKEPDLPPPACLTDGSGAQIPRDYIKRWKVNDGNKEQRLKEICYTMDLLTSKSIHELVVDAKIYERDFHLLCRGMYRIHNQKYSNRRLILETLIKEDFMTLLKVYWQEVMDEFELKKKEADPKLDNGQLWKDFADTQSYIVEALGNCFHMLVVVWNGSDMKIPQTLSLLYDGTVELFLQALDKYLYPLEVNSIHPQHKVVKAFLGIIHNFCNKHDSSVSDLRERDALRIIGKYRNSGTTTLKTKTILAYSYLLSEEDDKNRSVIELEEADIKFVIAVLKDALNSPDDHSKLYGYHAEELIVGLNNIAVVDSNKQRLVDAGILPLYVGAMGRQKPLLQQCAAQGIWTLGFDEKSMQRIKEEPGCMDALRKLASSTKPDVKVAAKGALWKVEGEIKHLQRVNEKQVKGAQTSKKKLQHIMISYQWDVQEEVMMLREKLKEAGYRVWIDVEQMHKTKTGDTLMAMAKAVSNTVLMIPVLTEKYPVSNACRQEITYANKLNKKLVPVRLQAKYRPEGWLAMLLAGVFFYDLTKPSEYEQKIADLIQSLGKDAKILPGESENPASDDEEEAVATITKSVVPPLSAAQDFNTNVETSDSNTKTVFNVARLRCVRWSKEQVGDWFKSVDLEKYTKKFAGFDGRLLAELAAVQHISPDAYYPMLRQEYGMSLIDILKLNAALRGLNPSST